MINKNIKQRIAVAFSIAMLLLLIISIISYKNIFELTGKNEQINRLKDNSDKLASVNSGIATIVASGRGYIVWQDSVYLIEFEESKSNINNNLVYLLNTFSADSLFHQEIIKLDSLINLRINITENVIRVVDSSGSVAASDSLINQHGPAILTQIQHLINNLRKKLLNKEKDLIGSVAETNKVTQIAVILGSIMAIGFILAATIFITKDIDKRIKAETDLKRSEQLYRTLIKNFPEGAILLYDKSFNLRIADGFLFREIGYTSSSLSGKHLSTIFGEEDKKISGSYAAVFKGNTSSTEISIGHKKIQATFVPIRIESQEVMGGIGILQDITARKIAEEELKSSELLYRTIIASVPNGMLGLYDKNLNIVLIDGQEFSEFGWKKDEIEGKSLEKLLPVSKFEKIKEKYSRVFKGESSVFELNLGDKQYLTSCRPYRNEHGEIIAGLTSLQNITDLKEFEKKLQRSNDFYLTLFEEFPSMIYRAGPDSRCNYHNKTWLQFTGRTFEQELGTGWTEGVHPNDREYCYKTYINAFDKRQPYVIEYRIKRFDGEYRWLADHGRPYYDLEGNFAGYIGSAYDITDRITNEEKIRKQNRFVTMIHDIAIAANEAKNPESAIRYTLKEICTTLNLPLGHVFYVSENKVELNSSTVWFVKDHKKYKDFIDISEHVSLKIGEILPGKALEIKKPVFLESTVAETRFTRMKAAEENGLVSAFAFPILSGERVDAVMEFFSNKPLYQDPDLVNVLNSISSQLGRIIERKKAEELLNKSKDVLKTAQEIAHVGSWEWNMESGSLFWSDELYRIYKLDPEDPITYEKYMSHIHPDDVEKLVGVIQDSIIKMSEFQIEHRIHDNTGDIRILLCKGKPSLKNGELSGLIGIAHDITDVKKAEESLKEANKSLQETQKELIMSEKMAAIGRISASMAHEIRNPLANITAASQLLISRFKEEKYLISYLDIVLRNADIANRIIKELLDYVSPKDIELKEGNVVNVIKQVCNLISPRCIQQQVDLKCIVEDDEVILSKMNEAKLEEALLNFATNSLDAMPSGGSLKFKLHENNSYVHLTIEDTGEGIPEENLDKIFEPFFTTKATGTGLGMSLAEQIIKAHNGIININSYLNQGTQVEIKILKEEK